MSFGTTLAKARKRAGLTQEALAEKAGITRGLLSLLEIDHRSVPPESVTMLADALQLQNQERADFISAAHLTHGTDDLRQMLEESRAQVKFLADLVGLGHPVQPTQESIEKYGQEAAELLAVRGRANQKLYDQLLEVKGKRMPPRISGADEKEMPDSPLAPPAAPFGRKRKGKGKEQ